MKRPISIGLWAVLVCSSVGCGDDDDDREPDAGGSLDAGLDSGGLDASADAGTDGGIDPRFEELAVAIESDISLNNATAASVAVWLDGEIVWVGGFGEIDGGGPIDEDTLFMIGSDTKKTTAMALLRQVEAGAATLETTVAEVLPDLQMAIAPEFLEATIHDLLSHQGGIMDGVELTAETDDGGLRAFALGEFAETYYSLAPPGRIWNYSNPNFSIAGLMNQELDGRLWPDIIVEDVYAPLGMLRTVARKSAVDANHAPGVGITSWDDETIDVVPLEETWESAFTRPAGLVWSTPSDQMRLAVFLVDGDEGVLGDDLRETLTSPLVPTYPDLPGDYGYGLSIAPGFLLRADWYDVPIWSHGGNTQTHTSTFVVLPEQRFGICILSNGLGDDFVESLVVAIETLVDLPAPGIEPLPPFEPDELDDLVGSYMDEHNAGELIISREGDALRLSAPLLDDLEIPYVHEMRPLSTRVWIVNAQGQDLDFAFIDGPDGEMYFRNRAVVAIRPPLGRHAHRAPAPPSLRVQPDARRLRAVLRKAQLEAVPVLWRALRPARWSSAGGPETQHN